MAHKSMTISSGFDRLMSFLALPLVARPTYRNEQVKLNMRERHNRKLAFHIWPNIPGRVMDPQERMQADLARLRQATFITSIR